jgi:hypothetical protein
MINMKTGPGCGFWIFITEQFDLKILRIGIGIWEGSIFEGDSEGAGVSVYYPQKSPRKSHDSNQEMPAGVETASCPNTKRAMGKNNFAGGRDSCCWPDCPCRGIDLQVLYAFEILSILYDCGDGGQSGNGELAHFQNKS